MLAANEAKAIKKAADLARSMGVKVLLTLGPGSPTAHPIQECMNRAFQTVTFLLYYYLGATDLFVDYSGKEAGAGTVAPPDAAYWMDPAKTELWQGDGVHVSCDRKRFEPGTRYSNDNCIDVATEAERRSKVGAWRLAKTVLKAYQHFQNL